MPIHPGQESEGVEQSAGERWCREQIERHLRFVKLKQSIKNAKPKARKS